MSEQILIRQCDSCGMTTACDIDASDEHEEQLQLAGQTVRRVPRQEGLELWKFAGRCACGEKKWPRGTEARVCGDIAIRQQLGINKYKTTVADNPLELSEWLQHAYEETLDQAIYLRRAMEEMARKAAK